MNTCKLCQQPRPLCWSHIIPNFLLREAEDQIATGTKRQAQPHLAQFDFFTTKEIICLQKGNAYKKWGFTEQLLCAPCESNLSRGEKYVRQTFYGTRSPKIDAPASKFRVRYVNVDGRSLRFGIEERWVEYALFKQFQIGVIWKACVASGEAFRQAMTSPACLERMRKALLTSSFDENLAVCQMTKLFGPIKATMLVCAPDRVHIQGKNPIRIVMGGYMWDYYLEDAASDGSLLHTNGKLSALVVDLDYFYTPSWMIKKS